MTWCVLDFKLTLYKGSGFSTDTETTNKQR